MLSVNEHFLLVFVLCFVMLSEFLAFVVNFLDQVSEDVFMSA